MGAKQRAVNPKCYFSPENTLKYTTNLLTEAFRKAQDLSDYLQNELAEQLIEDVENEIKWQQ